MLYERFKKHLNLRRPIAQMWFDKVEELGHEYYNVFAGFVQALMNGQLPLEGNGGEPCKRDRSNPVGTDL